MIKQYFSLLCLLSFWGNANILFAQKPQPESTLKFAYKTPESEIQQKIESSQSVFQQEQWSAVELFVRQNNNSIDNKIREIDAQTDDVYRKLKQLYAASNIVELQNNVKALEASRQKILEETEKQLQQIVFRGVYLAIVNGVKPYDKDATHVENIKNAILPDAVTALNGAFLQNIVALKDNKVEYDYLTERVSGSMTMGAVEFEERSFSGGYFVQVRQVEVSPLQKKVDGSNATGTGQKPANVAISDLLNNPDASSVLSKLTDIELRAKIEKCIMEKVPTVASEVRNFNLTATQNEAAIVQEAKEKLADLDKKIQLAKAELERNMENAKKVMTDAGISFDPNRLAEGIAAARQKLVSQLNAFNQQKKQIKTDELVIKVFDVSAQGGDPASALAREAASKAAVIQTEYSQIRGFLREIKIENQAVADYASGSSADAYRELESYWLYPVPNSNSFRLGIVGKFRMTDAPKGQEVILIPLDTKPTKGTTSTSTTPAKSEIEPAKPTFIRTKQFDLDPRLAQPELKQAESYFEQEKFGDAYAIYEKHFESQALQAHHQVQIGYMLRNGFGTRQDYYNAFKWYMKAAQQGDSGGQCNVAYMYKNGYGVGVNYEEAVKWYRLSADQGNAMSQNNLGYMYEKGLGVKRNMPEAIVLYRKAAKQGNDLAIKNLERLGL